MVLGLNGVGTYMPILTDCHRGNLMVLGCSSAKFRIWLNVVGHCERDLCDPTKKNDTWLPSLVPTSGHSVTSGHRLTSKHRNQALCIPAWHL